MGGNHPKPSYPANSSNLSLDPLSCDVIFLAGGPGAGKTTQGENLMMRNGDWIHISTGDLLRDAMNKGDDHANRIKHYVNAGELVPSYEIVHMLHSEMLRFEGDQKTFIIDGFPRSMDNLLVWDSLIKGVRIVCVIVIRCPKEVLHDRIFGHLPRGEVISGELLPRDDDTPEAFAMRMGVYEDETEEVIKAIRGRTENVFEVNGNRSVAEVTQEIVERIEQSQRNL